MDMWKIRAKAYSEGSKVGFVAGIIFSSVVALAVRRAKSGKSERYPFSYQK